MSDCNKHIHIYVNNLELVFLTELETGCGIKDSAEIPRHHHLYYGPKPKGNTHCLDDRFEEIENDESFELHSGMHFWSSDKAIGVTVVINRKKFVFDDPCQSGTAIKQIAGIELGDVLFRDRPSEDEVVTNGGKVQLHCGDRFYSSPPANYGDFDLSNEDVGCPNFTCIAGNEGWHYLTIPDFKLPGGYTQNSAELLIKLPPGFPDAAPDMFWVSPHLKTKNGVEPQGTCTESFLNRSWQRFSWHLCPGAWRPGISTLRDFIRCVRSRFEKCN